MPQAISDFDRRLQAALRSSRSYPEHSVCRWLGPGYEVIAELHEAEVAAVFTDAKSLVREALAALVEHLGAQLE